jgi:hypothetical protein
VESKWSNELLEVIGVVEDFRYRLLINQQYPSRKVLL